MDEDGEDFDAPSPEKSSVEIQTDISPQIKNELPSPEMDLIRYTKTTVPLRK